MNMIVNQNDFDTYKDQSRQALKAMKEHCNSDTFISDCKRIAYEKIKQALDSNGQLVWSKLPKLIGQNTKISKDIATDAPEAKKPQGLLAKPQTQEEKTNGN